MEADTRRMRGPRPWVFTNLKSGEGLERIVSFIVTAGGLDERTAPAAPAGAPTAEGLVLRPQF